jgi:hypothetical protein
MSGKPRPITRITRVLPTVYTNHLTLGSSAVKWLRASGRGVTKKA